MIEITPNEMKEIQLEILKDISEFCKKNNLKFYLDSGTLLGAVRHKGFIPWDDDIDISMPRKDYEKLISLYNSNKNYKVITFKNKGYDTVFAKIYDNRTKISQNNFSDTPNLGVFVDIFPIDYIPKNVIKKNFLLIKSFIFIRLASIESMKKVPNATFIKNLVFNMLKKLSRIIPTKKILSNVDKGLKYNKESDMVTLITSGTKWNQTYPTYYFDGNIQVLFEGEEFPAPIKFKEYLTELYGDYSKLPPEEQRKGQHLIKAYWVDR